MRWIDTTDLKNWASRRDCQGYLPLVIRRLIRATVADISCRQIQGVKSLFLTVNQTICQE